MELKNRIGALIAATFTVAVSLPVLAPVLAAAADSGLSQTAPTEDVKQARMMQEIMIKMHEQLHRIVEAKDPAERETTQAFMKQMRENMGAMKGSAMMGGTGPVGAEKTPTGE
jgi:cytochrome c556